MHSLVHLSQYFVVSLIKAFELKSDLRLYKLEKKITRTGNYVDNDADESNFKQRNYFGLGPFRFQHSKQTFDHGIKDFSVFHKIINDGTTENYLSKSAIGFLGGILLTYICYLFLIYSLNFTLRRATLICIGLGVILSLGLAFSVRIRCTVLLCLPQLFSKRGRQALLAYAFILALSGPAKNTLHNVEVMSESLACGQEKLKKAENDLLKYVQRPNTAVKQALENILRKLDFAVQGYKTFIERFHKECEAVIEKIIHAQEWMYSIYVLCNEKMGSPYSRCTDLLFEQSENCKAVSSEDEWTKACEMEDKKDYICHTENGPVCSVEDLPPFWPLVNYRKRLSDFRREAMNVIYVKVETHEIFSLPNRNTTLHEEYQGMATEIRQKTDQFLQYFDVMSLIFGIFILVLFIKVVIYRYKFLTEDGYDNRFITSDFIDIDKTRAEFGMQTLLPLEPRERKKYIRVTSMRLVPYERGRLFSSFIFLMFATFKIIIHMLTDCSLYWMLSTMRRHGRMLLAGNDNDVPQITVMVNGTGIYAEFLNNITKIVRPYVVQQILDPIPCLPDPIPPDWNRYSQILTLVLVCWLLAFCEPYGLRLRHIVMVTYYPDRARERAIWLYNRILTTRINFVKFARRQLRRRYKDIDEKVFLRPRFWFIKRRSICLLCKENLYDKTTIKCQTPGCVGIYCIYCFQTLQICSICKDPSSYGDYSDVSEEKDSDEEDRHPCSKCGCPSQKMNSLHQEPIKEYYTYHVTPNLHKDYPNFQISMDTIINVNQQFSNQSQEEQRNVKEKDTPIISPPVLTRVMQECRKAVEAKYRLLEESVSWDKNKKPKISPSLKNNFDGVYIFTNSRDVSNGSDSSKRKRNTSKPLRYLQYGVLQRDKDRKNKRKEQKIRIFSPKETTDNLIDDSIVKRSWKKATTSSKEISLIVKALKKLQIFKWNLKDKFTNSVQSKETRISNKSMDIKEQLTNVCSPDMRNNTEQKVEESSSATHTTLNKQHPLDITISKTVFTCDSLSPKKINKATDGESVELQCCQVNELCCRIHGSCARASTFASKPSASIKSSPERWSQIRFKMLCTCQKMMTLEGLKSEHSRTDLSLMSSSGENQHTNLTNNQTTLTESDGLLVLSHNCETVSNVQLLNSGDSQQSRTISLRSSPSSSSTYSGIRKEFVDVCRRRQKSRESILERSRKRSKKGRRKTRRCNARYETTSESSVEVKQKRPCSRKPRITITVTDGDVILTNTTQKVLSKKVDMMRAKLAKFFKRSIKRRSSSNDGDITDIENEEYLPISAVFISEDEFHEFRKVEDKGEDENKKLVQAPDLLSDLPSSKAPGSAGESAYHDNHLDSDLEY